MGFLGCRSQIMGRKRMEFSCSHHSPGVWIAALVLLQLWAGGFSNAAFLQEQLPLKVLVTTPTSLATYKDKAASVTVTGRQAITAVFSRPVIALGSDWGSKELPDSLVPFKLSCGIPGRLRWVTTNIARFDPAVEWPTDLACSFNWNTALKSYDGAPLVLDGTSASVPLATQPLRWDLVSVASEAASNATDGLWSATTGLPDDKLPEVPPDGNITLSFSYPVELSKLASALQLVGPDASGQSITVSPCPTSSDVIVWPLVFSANGSPKAGTTPSSGSGVSSADLLKLNSSCAVVKVVPGLAPGAAAVLRLPVGARYSSVAGPITTNTDQQVYGLRPFRIPLQWDFQNITNGSQTVYNGVRYRRITMWLPHGLAAGTQLSALKPLIKICAFSDPFADNSACTDKAFELSRPSNGTLVASVPELTPKQHYRVTVNADATVKDVFGLPLQASANTWWTVDLQSAFQGPNMNQVALLEALPNGPALDWPWVSRGKPEAGLDKVQAWDIAVPSSDAAAANSNMARVMASLNYGYSGVASNAFGTSVTSISRSTSPAPNFQSLALPGKPGVSFVGSCCRDVTWPTARKVFASNLLVVRSNLQAAFVAAQGGGVVAWVTTTLNASKPVAGAKVQVYVSQYNQDFAALGPSCTTSTTGTCTLDFSSKANGGSSFDNAVKSALITAPGEGPLVVPQLPASYSNAGNKYSGAIVLDRQLVKPGDDLHVTAYIQKRNGTQLQAAKDLTSVILQVTPSWNPAEPSGSTRLTVPVNTTYGSARATVSVPKNATPANYNLQLFTVSKTSSSSSLQPVPLVEPIGLAADSAGAAAVDGSASEGVSIPGAGAPVPEQGVPSAFAGVVPPVLPPPVVDAPGDFIASTSFTVADPRPPTAALNISAPAWVKANGSLTATLQAESYIGSDVSGANMTLEWDTGKAQGSLNLTTNSQGIATGTVDLSKLPSANVSDPGDILTLSVNWVGPTREVISASTTVKIADGPVRVELQRTLLTDVPGIKFGVQADAFSNEDDSPITGKSVEVSLVAANGTASLTNCSSTQLAALSEQKCTIKSGEPRAASWCQLFLPCMGEFMLKGCADGSCGKPIRIGRNASWWQASPWSSAPQLNLLPDRQNVTIGGELNLAVQNPWWGPTSGLLVFGNAIEQEVRFLPQIPPGPSTIAISNLGEECRGSCRFSLTLAVARNTTPATSAPATQMNRFVNPPRNIFPFNIQIRIPAFDKEPQASGPAVPRPAAQFASTDSPSSGDSSNFGILKFWPFSSSSSASASVNATAMTSTGLPDVPTSALFDPLAPRTVYAEVAVSGPQPGPVNVTVAVEGQATTADGVAVLAPKSGKGTIRVTVRDAARQPVPNAEVTLLVVDKAILDLMPYDLQNVSSLIAPDLSTTFSLADLNSLRTSMAAINATFSALQRRLLQLDPWLPVDTQVTPLGGSYYADGFGIPPQPAAVDVPDAKYLAGYTTAITPLPYKPCIFGQACPVPFSAQFIGMTKPLAAEADNGAVAMVAMAAPAPMAAAVAGPMMAKGAASNAATNTARSASSATGAAAGAGGQAAAAPGAELRLQQDFKVTPLFTVIKATADGSAAATFTAPDNLGTFVVRAYAAAPKPASVSDPVGVVYGSAESELVVRRTVSLTPSLPRQVRAGDNFTAGVLVDAPGVTAETKVTVTAALVAPKGEGSVSNPLALNDPASVTVTLGPGNTQQEARFNFRARGLGVQNITFKASAGSSDVADQVQLEVPVGGKQGAVWLATSFAVRGSNSSTVANRVEGLALPRADNGSGSVSLVAGVGYLPAIQGTYEGLVRQGLTAYRDCPSGANSITLSVMPAMLAAYHPVSAAPSSYLTTFQLNTTLQALKQASSLLTDATYGLLPVDPRCLYPFSKGPERADVSLNAWATWLVEQLSSAPASSGTVGFTTDKGLAADWGALRTATKTWRKALELQLVADAVAARSAQPPRAFQDLDTLSWARLVLGSGWNPSGVGADVQKDLSMDRMVAAAVNMSVGAQARVGLTLLSSSSSSSEVGKITNRLLSNTRVGGRTAYVATGDGQRGAAALSDQSMALLLFLRSKTDNPLIQKIAAWVGQGAAPPPIRAFGAVCISSNPWESALRGQALATYDESTSSATPNVTLTAVAALPGTSSNNGNSAKQFQENPVPLLSARFNFSNAGEVARSSTKWDKIPAGSSLVFNAKGSGEISIAASLNFTPEQLLPFPTYRGLWVQRVVQLAGSDGGSLKGVGLGKIVTMAVQVTSPDDQSNVVVEVLMPGGLEPLDPNVYTDADLATTCSSSEDESDLSAGGSGGSSSTSSKIGRIGLAAYPGVLNVGAVPLVSVSYSGGSGAASSSSPYHAVMWWLPWPVCPVQTTSPASVVFSFSYFRAGTQTIRFKAVAATSGVFALPPVKVYVQQQPEVMGLSPAGVFTVCPTADDCPAAQQLLAADPAAKACPKDCSGNGACNLASGSCICDAGFSGADCGTFSSSR